MNINKVYKIGWDVGGAHLKAVLLDPENRVLNVIQLACPLWQGIDHLAAAVDDVMTAFAQPLAHHAVTMTGELTDIFKNRQHGVSEIATTMRDKLGELTRFYAGSRGFVTASNIDAFHSQVASANWYASASLLAKKLEQGLLVDIGSTTTDLIVLLDGIPANRGFSDAERMREDELVYTGVVRTPLMALTQTISFNGYQYRVAAEHFATTADIYRITGELMETEDMASTADSAEKSMGASMRRLARMLGHDREDADDADWLSLAQSFKSVQLEQLENAATNLLARYSLEAKAPFIAAGTGRFLARKLAQRFQRNCIQVESLIASQTDEMRRWAGVCFPAYAVACLMTDDDV